MAGDLDRSHVRPATNRRRPSLHTPVESEGPLWPIGRRIGVLTSNTSVRWCYRRFPRRISRSARGRTPSAASGRPRTHPGPGRTIPRASFRQARHQDPRSTQSSMSHRSWRCWWLRLAKSVEPARHVLERVGVKCVWGRQREEASKVQQGLRVSRHSGTTRPA